ncbi:MAG: PilZ domain-containing protein [Terriglobales bacterium]
MGKRREPRVDKVVPVRIFGTDTNGQIFSEKLTTLNVSRQGAELGGVQAQLKMGEIIGLTYGTNKIHLRVMWVGAPGTPKQGRIGLLNLSPEKPLWDFPLPGPGIDGTGTVARDPHDRRAHPRFKTTNSVEVHPQGQDAPIRARTVDMSMGGCFIEMPNPLPKGTEIKIGIWVNDTKLWATGRVVTSNPGFGIGVQFIEITEQDKSQLLRFLESTVRITR